jgi:hypothetical protein
VIIRKLLLGTVGVVVVWRGSNAGACEQRREQRWVRVMEASEDRGEVRAGKGRASWLLEGTGGQTNRDTDWPSHSGPSADDVAASLRHAKAAPA